MDVSMVGVSEASLVGCDPRRGAREVGGRGGHHHTTHYGAHSVPGQTLSPRVARIGISVVSWPENRPSLGGGGVPDDDDDDDDGWFVGSTIGRMFVMISDHSGPMPIYFRGGGGGGA